MPDTVADDLPAIQIFVIEEVDEAVGRKGGSAGQRQRAKPSEHAPIINGQTPNRRGGSLLREELPDDRAGVRRPGMAGAFQDVSRHPAGGPAALVFQLLPGRVLRHAGRRLATVQRRPFGDGIPRRQYRRLHRAHLLFTAFEGHQLVGRTEEHQYRDRPRRMAAVRQPLREGADHRRDGGNFVRQFASQPVRHQAAVRDAGHVDALRIHAGRGYQVVDEGGEESHVVHVVLLRRPLRDAAQVVPMLLVAVHVSHQESVGVGQIVEVRGGHHARRIAARAVQHQYQRRFVAVGKVGRRVQAPGARQTPVLHGGKRQSVAGLTDGRRRREEQQHCPQ